MLYDVSFLLLLAYGKVMFVYLYNYIDKSPNVWYNYTVYIYAFARRTK